MNAPTKILAYFVAVLLLGSLLSAPLFWGVQRLAPMAEAKGWLRYETAGEDRAEWETRGWLGAPLRAGVSLAAPLAENHGWLHLEKEKAPETKEDRKDKETKAERQLRRSTALAEKRGWFRAYLGQTGEPERDAKGWCSFLDANFSKVSNRAILLVAVALLWPLLRSLKIRSLAEIGLQRNPHRWRDFAAGWLISAAVMALVGAGMLYFGVYRMQDSPPWKDLLAIFFSGISVAFLEEWIFRGAILGSFRRYSRDYTALLAVSALFSILHFLKSPDHALPAESVNWLSGFTILPQRFTKFEQPLELLAGFTTLFIFGWIAGWATIRTRGLALGMGFHAGMVFAKMGFNRVTTRPKGMRDLLPWIGEDIAVGILGIGVLLLVLAALWFYTRWLRPREK